VTPVVAKRRSSIRLIALGGTISRDAAAIDNRPRHSAADLVGTVPAVAEFADVVPTDLTRVSSSALALADIVALATAIREAADAGHDGVVVTHGTDTIEETAYLLALMIPRFFPTVLTGAMRTAGALGADGPANLLAAMRVAATSAVGLLGPVVVLQDEIHLARWVTKVHTARSAAFASPGWGPIGAVHEGCVRLWGAPLDEDYLAAPADLTARVELVWVALGTDGLLVDAVVDQVDGLVVAAAGGGHVAPVLADSLGRAVLNGIPVVLASRTGSGPVLEDTYSGIGAERHLLSLGLRPAGTLTPVKARLRLIVAISGGLHPGVAFPEIVTHERPSEDQRHLGSRPAA